MATGLMAAASDDIPATVLIETIEEGYIKLGEINKLKKVNG